MFCKTGGTEDVTDDDEEDDDDVCEDMYDGNVFRSIIGFDEDDVICVSNGDDVALLNCTEEKLKECTGFIGKESNGLNRELTSTVGPCGISDTCP